MGCETSCRRRMRLGALLFLLLISALAHQCFAGELAKFDRHTGAVVRIAVSPDGNFLATVGVDRFCNVLDLSTRQFLFQLGPHPGALTGVAFTKDKSVLVSMLANDQDRSNVVEWDLGRKQLKRKFGDTDISVYGVQFSPAGNFFSITMGDANARIYSSLDVTNRVGLVSYSPTVKCLCTAFSPDGKFLRLGSGAGSTRWKLEGAVRPAGHIQGEEEAVTTCLAYLPDGKQFVSSHTDGELRIWKEEEGTLVAKIAAHKGEATSVAVSGDGKLLVTGGADKLVRVWNVEDQKLVKELSGHQGAVTSVVFISKGGTVASSSQDGTVRFWSLEDKAIASVTPMPLPMPAAPKPMLPAAPVFKALPTPDPAAVAKSIELMKTVFEEDYAAKKPADKLKFAEKLIAQAKDEKLDPAERFALYQESFRIALEANNVDAALKAVQLSAEKFAQPADAQLQTAKRLLDTATATNDCVELSTAALAWAEQARVAEKFEEADQLARVSGRAAVKGRSLPLQKSAKDFIDRVKREQERFVTFQAATKTLQDRPADPDANLQVGQYLCFTRGEWQAGINYLALGSGPLKEIAAKELALGAEAAERVAVAEKWQAVALEMPEADRGACLASALYWYEKALPSLTGFQKLKVEQAMKKMPAGAVQRK